MLFLSVYRRKNPVSVHKSSLYAVKSKSSANLVHSSIHLHKLLPLFDTLKQIYLLPVIVCNEVCSSDSDTTDYINLLHASGLYEKQTAKIIPFRSIDIFENEVSAGTGNFLVDGPKETFNINESILPEGTTFGVRISGDSMAPEFSDGQIAWVLQQESVANGEIGIFSLNGEAYIKKLQNDKDGIFLVSLNEKYAPIPIGEDDRLDIFGKVLGKCSPADIAKNCK